ncbi:hypothetical protein Gogos_011802 [Gossypium gossypioides]|uniref:RNase H type-1 domain-containing protein n=1 Tax=Gossypium gossypioides TaxID=34282 RepID=A0A7J9BQK0_GOSGO|nr:hypothetical protein [Gossypium gossypioides]
MEGNNSLRFMEFYGHVDLNLRNSSWDILKTMESSGGVTQNVNNRLARQIMDDEILEAFNQIYPRKAPSIDHPLFVGKKKSMAFHNILNRFSCNINSWSKRVLSYGSKEVFIKSILQSLPAYALSVFHVPRDGRLLDKDYLYYVDWLEDVMRILDRKVVEDFITMLWNSWNNHNNFVYYGKEDEARVVWNRARTFCHDFWIHNLVNKPVLPLTPIVKKWEKPPCGSVKINVDATVLNNKIGFGVIIRDSDGFVLGRGIGFNDELMTTEWAKLYAFEEGLKLAHSLNINNAIFKTDCASLVNRFKKCKDDITIIGHRIKEIYKTLEMFTTTDVKWANLSCNNVADFICKYAFLNTCNMLFGMDYPRDIHDIVFRDSFN